MAFLCKIWLPAWALFVIGGLLGDANPHSSGPKLLGAIGLIWLWIDAPVTIVYLIIRIARRATRDSVGA